MLGGGKLEILKIIIITTITNGYSKINRLFKTVLLLLAYLFTGELS
jgi:hypothetical protein